MDSSLEPRTHNATESQSPVRVVDLPAFLGRIQQKKWETIRSEAWKYQIIFSIAIL
jgi:hypothetical protein